MASEPRLITLSIRPYNKLGSSTPSTARSGPELEAARENVTDDNLGALLAAGDTWTVE
jgi:hypothetical protein